MLLKAKVAELLLSNVMVNLAKRKNLYIDLCKLISKVNTDATKNIFSISFVAMLFVAFIEYKVNRKSVDLYQGTKSY